MGAGCGRPARSCASDRIAWNSSRRCDVSWRPTMADTSACRSSTRGPSGCVHRCVSVFASNAPTSSSHVRQFEQPRTGRHEQADRELDRRDVIDEIEARDRVEQVAVVVERHPGMERHEGRHERQRRRRGRALPPPRSLRACAPSRRMRQHPVVDRLDGARHEQAARVAQLAAAGRGASGGARP